MVVRQDGSEEAVILKTAAPYRFVAEIKTGKGPELHISAVLPDSNDRKLILLYKVRVSDQLL